MHGPDVLPVEKVVAVEAEPMQRAEPMGRSVESPAHEQARVKTRAVRSPHPSSVVGSAPASPAMKRLHNRIERVARVASAVLVTGETGVGKGVVARELHASSCRRRHPFIHVDCAALAPGLIESELFGHERGAFTGAAARKAGRLELAAAGTLFLDEIGDLSLAGQAKLLRALEDREFERLGGTETLCLRARVVAATNRDLHRAVAAGHFREDLFYRLAVIELRVPPLRERGVDIRRLFEEALWRVNPDGLQPPSLSASATGVLLRHGWPGNVRELINLAERLSVWWPGELVGEAELLEALGPVSPWERDPLARPSPCAQGIVQSVPPPGAPPRVPPPCLPSSQQIESTMRACGDNVSRAARHLGIPRSTLRYRLARTTPQQLFLPGVDPD